MQLQNIEFPPGKLWVIVPVKPLQRSKQRLKASLGALRPGLTLAMLSDVLQALQSSTSVTGVVVVTLDAQVAQRADAMGAVVVREAGTHGMNRAIAQGCAAATRSGATQLAVVPVDVPLLTGVEFDRLVDELSRSAIAPEKVMGIVPSTDRAGTNWLCIGTGFPFTPMYGSDSYLRHLEHARAEGLRPVTLNSPLVSLDIDEEVDLRAFLAFCREHPEFQATRTWQFLQESGHYLAADEVACTHPTEESNYACSKS